ncbi:hypothetical protein Tco_1520654, partial [Tanacetum coccineum]
MLNIMVPWFPKDNDDLEDYDEDEYPKKTTKNTFGTNEGDANALVEDEIEDQRMKFKDHEEMKIMLANYGVANGYQLWYKRNDYKSLLVYVVGMLKRECKEKVVEGSKAVKGNKKCTKQGIKLSKSPCKEKAVEGNMKWTKQGIKLSKSPSEKVTKRKTSDN